MASANIWLPSTAAGFLILENFAALRAYDYTVQDNYRLNFVLSKNTLGDQPGAWFHLVENGTFNFYQDDDETILLPEGSVGREAWIKVGGSGTGNEELPDGSVGSGNLTDELLAQINGIAINQQLLADQEALILALQAALDAAVASFDATSVSLTDTIDEAIANTETIRLVTEQGFIDLADRLDITDNGVTQTAAKVLLLENTVNDPATGLAATRSTIFNQYSTTSDANEAVAQSIELVRAEIFNPNGSGVLNSAFVAKVDTAVANANGAIATSLNALSAATAATAAELSNNYYTIALVDSAIAASEQTIIASISTSGFVTTAEIQNNYYTAVEADSAIATSVNSLEAQIFDSNGELVNAFVSQIASAVTTDDGGALATRVTNLETSVEDPTTGLAITRSQLISTQQTLANETTARAQAIQTLEASLASGLSATNQLVQTAQADADGNATAISNLSNRVTNTEGDIASADLTLASNTQRVTDAEGNISALSTSVAGLTTTANSANSRSITALNLASTVETDLNTAEETIVTLSNSVASLTTTANTANTNASSALTIASTASTDVNLLKARASLVASTTVAGRTRVAGMKATSTAAQTKLDFLGDTIRFLRDDGTAAIEYDTVSDQYTFNGILRAEALELVANDTMEIANPTPFGPDNLIRWEGPRNSSTYNETTNKVNYESLTKSNANIFWKNSVGDSFFGGQVFSRVVRVDNFTENNQPNPFISVRNIVSAGSRLVSASYFLDQEVLGNSFTAPPDVTPQVTIFIQRRRNNGAYVTIHSQTFNGTKSFVSAGNNVVTYYQDLSGTAEFLDDLSTTDTLEYKAYTSINYYFPPNRSGAEGVQRLDASSIEQL